MRDFSDEELQAWWFIASFFELLKLPQIKGFPIGF